MADAVIEASCSPTDIYVTVDLKTRPHPVEVNSKP